MHHNTMESADWPCADHEISDAAGLPLLRGGGGNERGDLLQVHAETVRAWIPEVIVSQVVKHRRRPAEIVAFLCSVPDGLLRTESRVASAGALCVRRSLAATEGVGELPRC